MLIFFSALLSLCLQGKVLKHEAFEAEVTANKGRVFGVVEMGQGEGTTAAPPHPLFTVQSPLTHLIPPSHSLILPLTPLIPASHSLIPSLTPFIPPLTPLIPPSQTCSPVTSVLATKPRWRHDASTSKSSGRTWRGGHSRRRRS